MKSNFDPHAGDVISLDLGGTLAQFVFVAHHDPDMARTNYCHSTEGAKSTVYHIREQAPDGEEYALKVMNTSYREPYLEEMSHLLHELFGSPGLTCSDRFCLTQSNSNSIKRYPDLDFATVMRWVRGRSWFVEHSTPEIKSARHALRLARALCKTLHSLERANLAHGSLAPENVLFGIFGGRVHVELVGLESMQGAQFRNNPYRRNATYGYTHASLMRSESLPRSDRFAGGLLIAEMLSWYEKAVCCQDCLYGAECFFDPREMNDPTSDRYKRLLTATQGQHRKLGQLLERVWLSASEDDLPTFEEWLSVLELTMSSKIEYAWIPDEDCFEVLPAASRWARRLETCQ